MIKRGLYDLLGKTIEHKKFGLCEVLEVVQPDEGKFIGKIVDTNETKKFVFSTQFFNNINDFETVNVKVAKKATPSRVHKKVDLDKYRNHPLVKKIDQQEGGYRTRHLYEEPETDQVDDNEPETDDNED
ncbi:hypothetical protein [Candidatus Xianfuyuplasma coldseepsis]|uniref:Uncharacterized protein n=1 Tax=Candidatus Xianfuyuplasma coldseepsis TaxID=2782163 RepID=A0A7L7KT53_9MOLU|nr:hypothetical protein [Xianfuyuplasma coldseepsis]QMS85416.1 hypothetical protein G4Z02_06490 [Xianfuyuplasma coldseepsis]